MATGYITLIAVVLAGWLVARAGELRVRHAIASVTIWLIAALGLVVTGGASAQTLQSRASIETGTLPDRWISGGPDCEKEPAFQIHPYNLDFIILRQSGCTSHEKPFLYLIFGEERAMLFDTGDGPVLTKQYVDQAIDAWLKGRGRQRDSLDLVVNHTHSHRDHKAGDWQFEGQPNTTVVPPNLAAVKQFFGIERWPEQIVEFDLGDRVIDIIPTPGHDEMHIAAYDRRTGILLTGDTVYPGRLYINFSLMEFRNSLERVADFTRGKPVAHVLGGHIEQSRTPFTDYEIRTTYQPEEHRLQLTRGDILSLLDAISHDAPALPIPLSNMTICGSYPTC